MNNSKWSKAQSFLKNLNKKWMNFEKGNCVQHPRLCFAIGAAVCQSGFKN
jgi:hypothetical protein